MWALRSVSEDVAKSAVQRGLVLPGSTHSSKPWLRYEYLIAAWKPHLLATAYTSYSLKTSGWDNSCGTWALFKLDRTIQILLDWDITSYGHKGSVCCLVSAALLLSWSIWTTSSRYNLETTIKPKVALAMHVCSSHQQLLPIIILPEEML